MKNFLSKLSLITVSLTLPAAALSPGEQVPIEALSKANFVQGEAPTEWAKDQVYIFECWATWCAPCLAAIPHVDSLYDTYHKDGLNIFGMNVWEDGLDKVEAFVEKKGDGMSYPVAYVGRGGEFETSWLKAAGVRGIPHAFVVKNGTLLFTAHPSSLSEELLEGILEGGEKGDRLVADFAIEQEKKAILQEQIQAFRVASRKGETSAMQEAHDQIAKMNAESAELPKMAFEIAIAGAEWEVADKLLASIENPKNANNSARILAFKIDESTDEIPASLREKAVAHLTSEISVHPYDRFAAARLQLALGQKEQALATAKEAAAMNPRLPKEAVDAFAASFETETPQTLSDFQKALSAGMRKKVEEAKK